MRLMRLPTKSLRPAMSLVLIVGAGVRGVRRKAKALTGPRMLRLLRARVLRVITVVAGH